MKKQYLLLILTFFLWGSIYVACKYAYAYIPPLTCLALKYILALVFFIPLAVRKGIRKVQKGHWKYFLFFGIAGYAIGVGMVMVATDVMDATLAALINAMMPVAISVLAAIMLHEKLTKFTIIGLVLSIIGVIIVLGIFNGGSTVTLLGMILSIGGLLAWAFMSVMTRKISNEYSSEQITLYSAVIAIPVCIIAAIVDFIINSRTVILNVPGIASILYIGIVCTGIGNVLWSQSLKKIEASVCSAFYPLQPLSSAIFGIILLKEQITVNFVIGAVLISIGIIISILGEKIFIRHN